MPAAGRGESPRSAERNSSLNLSEKLRPDRANPPAAVRVPRQAVQEKGEDAKSNGETAANFVYCYKISAKPVGFA